MDFEIRNTGEELPYVWNNFINDKCFFLCDFVSGKSTPREGYSTITNKGKGQKQHYRKFNRQAQEATQKKRKERHTVVLSRNQRKERKKQVHRQQRSKVAKLRSKIWSSYKYAVHLQHNRHLKPSVEVQPHWKTTHQFNYTELGKLNIPLDRVEETVLAKKGVLRRYNSTFENVTATSPALLKRDLMGRTLFLHPRSVRDRALTSFCSKGEGNVFATGRVLALLMSCVRAVHSFDIPLRKKDGVIFLDHRGSSRVMDYTTNETSRHNPSVADKDRKRLNSAFTLKRERTTINKIFGEQILLPREESLRFKQPSPFRLKEGMKKKLSEKGYIYKKIQLSSRITVVCRCEVDGVIGDSVECLNERSSGRGSKFRRQYFPYMINRAVHEFTYLKEGRWETLLETRPGTVIVREIQNNSFEFGRWIFEALISDAQHFQVGFVTRKNMNSDKSHDLLKIERYDTANIAEQFHVNLGNGYAILDNILSSIMTLEDGNYVLLKIPNKQCVNCYRIQDQDKTLDNEL